MAITDRQFLSKIFLNSSGRIVVAVIIAAMITLFSWIKGQFTPYTYLLAISIVYLSAPPKYLIHPKNILFAYHLIWYTFPVAFATRYEDFTFTTFTQMYSFTMLLGTYLTGMLTFHFSFRKKSNFSTNSIREINKIPLPVMNFIFIITTLLTILCTMALSRHGLIGWLSNPGLAFAERDGSGPLTILMIFLYGVALALGGFYIHKYHNSKILIFLYLIFLFAIFQVIVGRAKLLTFLLLIFLIPVYKLRFRIKYILALLVIIVSTVYFTSLLRGTFNDESGDVAKVALNYFDTYDALCQVVENEEPRLGSTFLMSMNKFLSPFGYDKNLPYTLSQKLTPVYFPGWGDRTTVQFPMEADMYLSFWYWGGLVLIFLYFYVINYFFVKAHKTMHLGDIFIAVSLLLYMISHLRGMLIDWTDLYYYPILVVSYYILNHKAITASARSN